MVYTGTAVGGRVFEGMLSTTGKSYGEGVVEVLVSSQKIPTSLLPSWKKDLCPLQAAIKKIACDCRQLK
jgi:hypothetical protein